MGIAAAALTAFLVSLGAATLLITRFSTFALDRPNERSLHEQPVPRTGGIAILAGGATVAAFAAFDLWLPAMVSLALAALSLADDLFDLPARVRFACHAIAAGSVALTLHAPVHPALLFTLVLAIAWTTNLYNFMDGADGMAGGMAIFGFGAYSLAAQAENATGLALFSASIAAAAGGFLLLNFHPARIFMGDVGSIPLGFLAGALGLTGWDMGVWPLWFPALVFGPFMCDATLTLLKRVVRGQPAWRAHRDHYYQRLIRMGFGHRRTACLAYAVMFVAAAAALYARGEPPSRQAAVFLGTLLAMSVIAVWIDVRWARTCKGQE